MLNSAAAPRWTRTDAIAGYALIGQIFGNGGGNEVLNADLLARLRQQLGPAGGERRVPRSARDQRPRRARHHVHSLPLDPGR